MIVMLTGKTNHGKNRIQRDGSFFIMNNATVRWRDEQGNLQESQDKQSGFKWCISVKNGEPRWVHPTGDKNFTVTV